MRSIRCGFSDISAVCLGDDLLIFGREQAALLRFNHDGPAMRHVLNGLDKPDASIVPRIGMLFCLNIYRSTQVHFCYQKLLQLQAIEVNLVTCSKQTN